jgi:hypothetical protein
MFEQEYNEELKDKNNNLRNNESSLNESLQINETT